MSNDRCKLPAARAAAWLADPYPNKKTDPKASLSLTKGSLESPIVPSGVYGGHGTIFAAENLIFQSKNRFPAVFAPENPKDFSKNW